jgi:hypothetical protein
MHKGRADGQSGVSVWLYVFIFSLQSPVPTCSSTRRIELRP